MNKKIYITAIVSLATAAILSAQTEAPQRAMYQVRDSSGGVVRVAPVAGLPVRAMMATGTPGVMPAGQMMIPMTGDEATDAQVKALVTEMQSKIEAIRKEYEVKIKEVIGDKQIVRRENEWGTSTARKPLPLQASDVAQMARERMTSGEYGSSTARNFGERVRGLFRSLFGGN